MAYSSIDKPRLNFANFQYMGNDGSGHALTGMGFQPDLIWIKNRERSSSQSAWDIQRGVNIIRFGNTGGEQAKSDRFTSIDSDGFTVTGTDDDTNRNGDAFQSFGWKAGGTASANTDGDIATDVSVNTASGFSIITYSGQSSAGTIGHGLGVEPHMVWIKNLSSSTSWHCYWKPLGNQGLNWLDSTAAASTSSSTWNSTTPTSSVISLNGGGSYSGTNDSGSDYVAYAFAPIQGFSAIGHMKGNGENDGPFIHLGFRPAWVVIKETGSGSSGGWFMWNQDPIGSNTGGSGPVLHNVIRQNLSIQTSDGISVSDNNRIDFLNNGFKVRDNDGTWNEDGMSAVYVAFARSTLVGTNGVPGTAV